MLATDKPRYRNKKGKIPINGLGLCSEDMQFIYVLTSQEGSATDDKVLHDAICKTNGLDVPNVKSYTRNK